MSLNLCAGAGSDDEAVGEKHCAIFHNSDIGKRVSTTGSAATQSQELRGSDECGDAQGLDSMPEGRNLGQRIRLQHRDFEVGIFCEGLGFRISGIDVTSHADAGIIGEHAFDALSHFFGAVGYCDLARML